MTRIVRIPSVKACIKRLSNLTIAELHTLGIRDLKNIVKLSTIILAADVEPSTRKGSPSLLPAPSLLAAYNGMHTANTETANV